MVCIMSRPTRCFEPRQAIWRTVPHVAANARTLRPPILDGIAASFFRPRDVGDVSLGSMDGWVDRILRAEVSIASPGVEMNY
jgi:hypothetical protein